jgi:hypothetical protein
MIWNGLNPYWLIRCRAEAFDRGSVFKRSATNGSLHVFEMIILRLIFSPKDKRNNP